MIFTPDFFITEPDPFRTEIARLVYVRTYSRYLPEEKRRETWAETVSRACNFLFKGKDLSLRDQVDIALAIYRHEIMPSMRIMWSAGPAAEKNNVSIYNCAYAAVDDLAVFSEALFILMSGTGFGFSVEDENVNKLPTIAVGGYCEPELFFIKDSREGWAAALSYGLCYWFAGGDILFDYSLIRPSGTPLKTMGGRSSGPKPLRRLLTYARDLIQGKRGQKLSPLDCHDLMCVIGEVVVVGGVRRSSLISLSDLGDHKMRDAKTGQFWLSNPQRSMANNSVAYNERPESEDFMEEWISLMKSGSGERGIFNREAALAMSPRRDAGNHVFGTNPCAEIILRPMQFCNLSTVVARAEDTQETLTSKVRLATILGTIQATFTNFPFLRDTWRVNCEEERLLGVSITGHMDSKIVRDPGVLGQLRATAINTNSLYAERFGIHQSVAVTCGKPEGTVSQLVTSGSGCHTWWSKHFIRRVRIDTTDPLFAFAKTLGIPHEPEVGQDAATATVWVLSFPVKAPKGAITRDILDALGQLENWKNIRTNYTEHSQSCTIYVAPHEWVPVAGWVYQNWSVVTGLSFLPTNDSVYRLAPYEEITEAEYERLLAAFPKNIDYTQLKHFETGDNTQGAQTLACTSGSCEI